MFTTKQFITRSLEQDDRCRTLFERSFCYGLSHVNIHIGTDVDGQLAKQGAIAQAVDSKNVLLSRRFRYLPRFDQLAILGHEFAHTIQLGRRGSDDRGSLESAAWEAATAALSGCEHEVAGAATGALNAHAIIGYSGAVPYYDWIRSEPLKSGGTMTLQGAPQKLMGKNRNLMQLMTLMAKSKSTDILIVEHGSQTGIRIPIIPGGSKIISVAVHLKKLLPLVEIAIEKQKAGAKKATSLNLSTTQVKTLKKLGFNAERLWFFSIVVRAIRAKKLNHIVLRTCFTGKGGSLLADPLELFRDLFGAKTVEGVKTFAAYGMVDIKTTLTKPRDFDRWVAAKRGSRRLWKYPNTNPGFAFTIGNSPYYKIHARVKNWSDVKGWIHSNLHPQAKYKNGSDFPIYLVNPSNPIFPLESGFQRQLRVTAPKVMILPI